MAAARSHLLQYPRLARLSAKQCAGCFCSRFACPPSVQFSGKRFEGGQVTLPEERRYLVSLAVSWPFHRSLTQGGWPG
ncbi:cell division control protein [Colletotrichum scovillei]|nr:cell division control protein [Colletotrichum scovillei]